MHITHAPIVYEERLTEAWALPAERQITAALQYLPVTYATASQEPPDTVALAVEVKEPGGTWQEVASTEPTSEEGTYKVPVPMPAMAPKFMEPGPVFRLRVKHHGRRDVRWSLRVEGL